MKKLFYTVFYALPCVVSVVRSSDDSPVYFVW